MQPLLVAPSDRRVCAGLDVADTQAGGDAAGVYVMTHVDVVPPKKDEAIVLLNDLASASRKDPGVLRFDVWQQASRPNHIMSSRYGATTRRATCMSWPIIPAPTAPNCCRWKVRCTTSGFTNRSADLYSTTAIISISTIASGWARPLIRSIVLVGNSSESQKI